MPLIKIKTLTRKLGNVPKLFIKRSQRFSSNIKVGQVTICLLDSYSELLSVELDPRPYLRRRRYKPVLISSPPGNLEFLEDKQSNAPWAQQSLCRYTT